MRALIFVVIALIALTVLVLHFRNSRNRKALLSDRSPVDLDEVYANKFSTMSREEFRQYWLQLAEVLDADPAIMRPDDRVSLHIPRHFPELAVDELERYLEESGVEQGSVDVGASIEKVLKCVRQAHEKRDPA